MNLILLPILEHSGRFGRPLAFVIPTDSNQGLLLLPFPTYCVNAANDLRLTGGLNYTSYII